MGKKTLHKEPVPRLSADLRKERAEQLKAIFPESVTETKVDFEKLRQSLGDAVDDQPERYSFTWAGKRNAIRLLQTPSRATLIPVPEESVDFNTTQNLFIEGDNLEVLKLLYKPYAGQVKMVYIDPPYNTGNDFVYPDNFADPLDSYLQMTAQKDGNGNLLTSNPETNGRYHSAWLSMMYPRLFIARQLMRDDGVIFISIDDHEIHNLRLMMNEIFGEENYLNTFCWVNNLKGRQISGSGAAKTYEYILAFAKKIEDVGLFEMSIEKLKALMPSSYKGFDYETENDENGDYVVKNELYNTNSAFNEETRPNLVFNIHYNFQAKEVKFSDITQDANFDGFVKIPPKKNNDSTHRYHAWRWSKGKIIKDITDLKFVKTEEGAKIYTKIREYNSTNLKDIITDITTTNGSGDAKELFDKVKYFDYPKPVELIKIFASQTENEDITLDFFAGSGTTAHAVMELNAADGNNRQCISVQLPEKCAKESVAYKAGYRTIADIAKERIRRAGKRIVKDAKNSSPDTGFKVFKLAKSNYKQWTGIEKKDAKNYTKAMKLFADPLEPGWKEMDVIYEVGLKEGYGLCSTIEQRKDIKDNTVYRVTDPSKDQFFCICLDEKIQPSTVKAMDSESRDLFVCRDIALSDGLAANLALQCRLKTI